MISEVYCLHCDSVQLIMLPESGQEITFYRCPQCRRQFAQRLGQSLTEYTPGSFLPLVLYGVTFSPKPQAEANRIAAMLRDQESGETLAWVARDIRLALASPLHTIRDIIPLRASEQDVREFLALVADKLDEEAQEAFSFLQSLQGHRGWVYSLAISANGRVLASGGSDQTVRLWNPRTGDLLRTWTEPTGAVLAVAISPDSRVIGSGSADQIIRLWDSQTGMLIHTLDGHAGWVHALAFSPDGTILASGSADTTIRLWSVQTGQLLRVLRGHSHPVHSVAISPDGKRVVSGSSGNTLCVWDLTTGQLLRTLHEHTGTIYCLAFTPLSPNAYWLVSGSADTTVRRWDINAPSGHVGYSPDSVPWENEPTHAGAVRSLAFHPTRPLLISSSEDKTIKLWNMHTGRLLRTVTGHGGPVYSMVISPDGKTLASCSQRIKLWQMR